jgi:hypothetical protein
MYVVRAFEIALRRAESAGDAFARARSGLAAVGCERAPLRLFLSDALTGTRRGCARAVAAFPELADLACTVEGSEVISSFDEGVPGSRARLESALDPERAQQLADGVPRAFPLNDSHFFFAPVPALLGAADSPVRGTGYPHVEVIAGEIALLSQWWLRGRRTRLLVGVREPLPPPGARDLPRVAAEAAALLAAMGAVGRERRRVEPSSGDERTAIERRVGRAEARLAELKLAWAGAAIQFPHRLAPEPAGGGDDALPLRVAMARVLAPRGYRPRSAPHPGGSWVLGKRTARDNELELRLELGPINRRLSARLVLVGPLWRHDLGRLPLTPDHPELPVGKGTLVRALENLACAAAAAEAMLVPPLEESHGDGFAWLSGVVA